MVYPPGFRVFTVLFRFRSLKLATGATCTSHDMEYFVQEHIGGLSSIASVGKLGKVE